MSDGSWRPKPEPTATSAAYWAATARDQLLIQRCRGCRNAQHYPRQNCIACSSRALDLELASGDGTIYSYTVARRPTHPRFADRGAYVIAIVELAEGPRLTTNVVNCDPDRVRIGDRVRVVFEDLGDGHKLPVFEPVDVPA